MTLEAKNVLFTILDEVVPQSLKDKVTELRKKAKKAVQSTEWTGIDRLQIFGYSKPKSKVQYHYGIDEDVFIYQIRLSDIETLKDAVERFKNVCTFYADWQEVSLDEAGKAILTLTDGKLAIDQTQPVRPKPESRVKKSTQMKKELEATVEAAGIDLDKTDLTQEQFEAWQAFLGTMQKKETEAEAEAS